MPERRRPASKDEGASHLSVVFRVLSGDPDSSDLDALLRGPKKGGPSFWSGLSVALFAALLIEFLCLGLISYLVPSPPKTANIVAALIIPLTLGAALSAPWIKSYLTGRRTLAIIAIGLMCLLSAGVMVLTLSNI